MDKVDELWFNNCVLITAQALIDGRSKQDCETAFHEIRELTENMGVIPEEKSEWAAQQFDNIYQKALEQIPLGKRIDIEAVQRMKERNL